MAMDKFCPPACRTGRLLLERLVLLSFVVVIACASKGKQTMNKKNLDTLESVGKELGVTFPAAAKLVGVMHERGIDDLIAAKVEMPAAEWPRFLATTPIEKDLFSPGVQGLLGSDEGFWDPHKAKALQVAQALLPQGRALNIGYDDSRHDIVVVYVVNHGT